jgi:hypothetical protein
MHAEPPHLPAIAPLPGPSWSLLAKDPMVQDPVSFRIAEDLLQRQTVQDRLKMSGRRAARLEGSDAERDRGGCATWWSGRRR